MEEFQAKQLALLERIALALEGIREDMQYEWAIEEEPEILEKL